MDCTFWSIAFNRSYAGKELPFEALYCGGAFCVTDQLPKTGKLGTVDNGPIDPVKRDAIGGKPLLSEQSPPTLAARIGLPQLE